MNNRFLDVVKNEVCLKSTVCSSTHPNNIWMWASQYSVCFPEHSAQTQMHKVLAHKNFSHLVLIYDNKLECVQICIGEN